jgi:magnesium chelatase family protein
LFVIIFILIFPPCFEKTTLVRRLPSILLPMILKEAKETTKIHSVSGKIKIYRIDESIPFEAHTKQPFALIC